MFNQPSLAVRLFQPPDTSSQVRSPGTIAEALTLNGWPLGYLLEFFSTAPPDLVCPAGQTRTVFRNVSVFQANFSRRRVKLTKLTVQTPSGRRYVCRSSLKIPCLLPGRIWPFHGSGIPCNNQLLFCMAPFAGYQQFYLFLR